MTKVLCLIDAREVNGPCRGLFQLAQSSRTLQAELVLGMFLMGGSYSPALDEAERRGFCTFALRQKGRFDRRPLVDARGLLRSEGIEILQSHSYKPALTAWLLQREFRLPWVAFAHGHTREDFKMALYNRLDLWLLRRADRVVAVSEATRDWLLRCGVLGGRIRVIRNAVDPADHLLGGRGVELRRKHGIDESASVVAVVGRLSPEKGQMTFIEAFGSVARTVPEARAWIVGAGPDQERLRRAAIQRGLERRIHFLGHVRDVSGIYAASDLVAIPSWSEGLPNVALEAMLHRRPIVATRVGGVAEALGPELSRNLVAPGDAGGLAAAMIRLLQDPSLRAELGEIGNRTVREKFVPEARARLVASVYRELLDQASGGIRAMKWKTIA